MLVLAVVLAGLSFWQSSHWASPVDLWENALAVAPNVPRPWINLASLAMDRRDDAEGERLLTAAMDAMPSRSKAEQDWTIDLVWANLALIRLRQGRLAEASALVNHAPYESARWQVCKAVKAICAA